MLSTLLLSALVAASAPVDAPVTTLTVPFADLELSRPADQKRLATRVRAAIRDLCRHPSRDLAAKAAALQCRQVAAAQTKPQIGRAIAAATRDAESIRFAARKEEDRS